MPTTKERNGLIGLVARKPLEMLLLVLVLALCGVKVPELLGQTTAGRLVDRVERNTKAIESFGERYVTCRDYELDRRRLDERLGELKDQINDLKTILMNAPWAPRRNP